MINITINGKLDLFSYKQEAFELPNSKVNVEKARGNEEILLKFFQKVVSGINEIKNIQIYFPYDCLEVECEYEFSYQIESLYQNQIGNLLHVQDRIKTLFVNNLLKNLKEFQNLLDMYLLN